MTNTRTRYTFWLLMILALIAYAVPWVLNPSHALDLNAYDFAEWLSLHPAEQQTTPPLRHTLLLRGQLTILTLMVAISSPRPLLTASWWLRLIIVSVMCVAQLPPLEFIRNLGDTNQQQQFILVVVSVMGSIIGMITPLHQIRWYVVAGLATTGILSLIIALPPALESMRAYQLPANAGIGSFMLAGVYIGIFLYSLNANRAAR